MKIYVQWTTNPASDWIEIDHTEWKDLPNKPEPKGGEVIDSELGLVCRVNVQGIIFGMDHIAVWEEGDVVKAVGWHDDPEDYKPEEYRASVFTFKPLFRDPRINGGWNTRQTKTGFNLSNWESFIKPDEKITRHGIWMNNDLYKEHTKHKPLGWRNWIE